MENDVLLYLDNRFDSIQKHQDEVNSKLFDKLEEIRVQTTKTNGRVNGLEKRETECPIQELKSFVEQQKSRNSKEYKLGDFILNIGLSSAIASCIIGIILFFGK